MLRLGVFALLLICLSGAFAQNVKVSLYIESLCPDCQNYVATTMTDVFNAEGVLDILDLEVVPFGNAHVDATGKITCQHGEEECKGNIVETCAITHNPNVTAYFPFIQCFEFNGGYAQHAERCATKVGLNYTRIQECTSTDEGHTLELEMAKKTPSDHKWVPWVVLNGQAITEESKLNDLLALICDAYQGPKPTGCSQKRTPSKPMRVSMANNNVVVA